MLVREDLNVPMRRNGAIIDYARDRRGRCRRSRWLHEHGARTIVLSHLGRPDGKPDPRFSLRPVAAALVGSARSVRSRSPATASARRPQHAVGELRDGDVLLLENVRFHPEEERNDPRIRARGSRRLGDLYVERRLRDRAPRARVDRRRSRICCRARPDC